jgi:hypothetical protein
MDQQQLLALIQYLGKAGIPEKDLIAMFGSQFGLSPSGVDENELFMQYMPTFQQVNQYDTDNSLRKSIAKDVMSGLPIWQIEQGISNAIANGDSGVEAGQTVADYVGLAKTLMGEFSAYNKASSSAKQDNVWNKYGVSATPEEQYSVEQLFPTLMPKLQEVKKLRPEYSSETLRAKMPNTMAPSSTGVSNVSGELQKAEQALRSGVQSYNFNGRNYSLTGLRDVVIPQLEEKSKTEKSTRDAMGKQVAEKKTRIYEVDNMSRRAQDSVRENEAELRKASNLFRYGKIDEKDLRRVQSDYNSSLEILARTRGLGKQAEASYSAAKPKTNAPIASTEKVVRETQYDPYFSKVATGVLSGLQQKIQQSGKTPFGDQVKTLAILQRIASGK